MTTAAGTTTVVGGIDHCIEQGVKLTGEHGWPNISKVAAGYVDPRQFDDRDVTLNLEPQGCIREIGEASSSPAPTASRSTGDRRDPLTAGHIAIKAAVELLTNDITTKLDPDIATGLGATFEEWLATPPRIVSNMGACPKAHDGLLTTSRSS